MKAIFFVTIMLFSNTVLANSEAIKQISLEEMATLMSQKLSDFKSLNESITRGGMRIRLCQYCHGKDGNSVRKLVPNLASQNPMYLLTQFEYFREGKRINRVMNELARGLTPEERINIVLYYASKDVKVDKTRASTQVNAFENGGMIYQRVCMTCHGAKGYGQKSLPRIAGQQFDFLKETLTNYKLRKNIRPESVMLGVAAQLSDADIEAVATFLSASE